MDSKIRSTLTSAELLGDWLRREVLPRLSVPLVYGDVRRGRAGAWLTQPCPLHNGERDSFHVHPDTLAWKCHSKCQDSGDVVAFVERRNGVGFVDAARYLAGLVGEELPGRGARGPHQPAAPRRSPPRPPPVYRRPPAAEVAALWAAAQPVTSDPEASAYLESRALCPATVEDRDLARVLPPGARLPRWTSCRGRSWAESGHRLVLPSYSATGRLESLRARLLRPPRVADELKALAPAGANVAGLLLADALGRRLFAGEPDAVELVRRGGVWIAEGETDWLTLASAWSDGAEDAPAVLGLVSGAWTPELAARLPDNVTLQLATDADEAGERYACEVVATLAARMRAGLVKVERRTWKMGRRSA